MYNPESIGLPQKVLKAQVLADWATWQCVDTGLNTISGRVLALSRDGRELYYITFTTDVIDGKPEGLHVNVYSTWILPAPVHRPGYLDVLHYFVENLGRKAREVEHKC